MFYELVVEEVGVVVVDVVVEVDVEFKLLCVDIEVIEVCILLLGEYDECEVLVIIWFGVGGVDVVDWVEMLMWMYICWVE